MAGATNAPIACGALGSYERGRVEAIAAALGGGLREVHADERSILLLDREPIEWRGGGAKGFGWVETDIWRPGALSGWADAACRGACGLVIEGRRRRLHSAVNGVGPVYWLDHRGATYFATRIDPLVRTSPRPLTIDWDAWAAIIALRYPLGRRTPFAEVRRLGPFETLERRLRRSRVRREDWPWLAVEPGSDLETAADDAAEALRETLRPLPSGLLCPLSGGRDSRLLTSLLAADGRAAGALTVSDDEGETLEEDLAATVAAELGIEQERLAGRPQDYPSEWEERARLVEHQFVDHAWLVPLARRLRGHSPPLPDGFAIDVLVQSDRHFYPPETLDLTDPRAARMALFATLRRYGHTELALAPQLGEPLLERARSEFLAVTRPYEGHPSQSSLAIYATRSVRGVSCYPAGLLAGNRVVAPGAADAVARAALSVTPPAKDRGRMYAALFERIAPAVGRLPSTADTARGLPRLPRRWRSTPALDHHRQLLAEGPLADRLSPALRAWLAAPDGVELSGDLRLGLEGISLLHSWWRRYRDILRPVDPAGLGG